MNEKMNELVSILNNAAIAYYNGEEIMSNLEYDMLLEELELLEKKTGVILPDSPTQRVGAAAVNKLPKVRHEYPAKSLAKTKDYEEFVSAFQKGFSATGCDDVILMWKLDGSTLQCTYNNGKLVTAATRGNGETGSDVTHNAKYIKGLPLSIPYKGKMVVRGEATMSYEEFDRINKSLPAEEQYKNPRNLANATIQLLDSNEMCKREIWFNAFNLVYMDNIPSTFYERLALLYGWGFNLVEAEIVKINVLKRTMKMWEYYIDECCFPVDGLVVAFNDASYAEKLPGTGHNPHVLVGYAFKWKDETAETVLRDIEWSASRTGLLNPVAVFDPVELAGTTVSRASVHNISYIMDKDLMIGDTITVYKANMIIPQIAENLSTNEERQSVKISSKYSLAEKCPVCNEVTGVHTSEDGETMTLLCVNPHCPAKMIGKFVHFCDRDCMNIEGMSEATIERFVEKGFIKEYADIFKLDRFRSEIIAMEGFGQKSYENLIVATEKARITDFVSFIHALGIPNIGKGQAKLFNKEYKGDIIEFFKDVQARKFFQYIDGIGEVIEDNLWRWGNDYLRFIVLPNVKYNDEIKNLMPLLIFKKEEESRAEKVLDGLTFVITGDVHHFKNRAELQAKIEELGGKATGSVTGKTSYLINNDVSSTSGKNKKAKELGIPIISEEEFLNMIK